MKAEERKETETNKLRAWLGRMQTKMQGRSLYIFVGTLVLLVAVVLVVLFWRSSVAAAESARWMELRETMEADDVDRYNKGIIQAEKHKDQPTVKIAKFMKARRVMYGDGMDRLGSMKREDRVKAIAAVEEGRGLYLEVADQLGDYPVLQQEAWLSCAKAEETLMGVPKAEEGSGFRGDFSRMIEYRKKAAAINSGSDASKSYDEKIAAQTGKKDAIQEFYRELNDWSDRVPDPKDPPPNKFGRPGLDFPID